MTSRRRNGLPECPLSNTESRDPRTCRRVDGTVQRTALFRRRYETEVRIRHTDSGPCQAYRVLLSDADHALLRASVRQEGVNVMFGPQGIAASTIAAAWRHGRT